MLVLLCHSSLGGNRGKSTEHGKHIGFKDRYSAALRENDDTNVLKHWIEFFCQAENPLVNCSSFQWGRRIIFKHTYTSYILLTQAKGLTEITGRQNTMPQVRCCWSKLLHSQKKKFCLMVTVIQGFGFTFHSEQCTATCTVTLSTVLSDWFNNDSEEWEPPTLISAPPPGVSLKGSSIQVWFKITYAITLGRMKMWRGQPLQLQVMRWLLAVIRKKSPPLKWSVIVFISKDSGLTVVKDRKFPVTVHTVSDFPPLPLSKPSRGKENFQKLSIFSARKKRGKEEINFTTLLLCCPEFCYSFFF